jgi:hypothetical protein
MLSGGEQHRYGQANQPVAKAAQSIIHQLRLGVLLCTCRWSSNRFLSIVDELRVEEKSELRSVGEVIDKHVTSRLQTFNTSFILCDLLKTTRLILYKVNTSRANSKRGIRRAPLSHMISLLNQRVGRVGISVYNET